MADDSEEVYDKRAIELCWCGHLRTQHQSYVMAQNTASTATTTPGRIYATYANHGECAFCTCTKYTWLGNVPSKKFADAIESGSKHATLLLTDLKDELAEMEERLRESARTIVAREKEIAALSERCDTLSSELSASGKYQQTLEEAIDKYKQMLKLVENPYVSSSWNGRNLLIDPRVSPVEGEYEKRQPGQAEPGKDPGVA